MIYKEILKTLSWNDINKCQHKYGLSQKEFSCFLELKFNLTKFFLEYPHVKHCWKKIIFKKTVSFRKLIDNLDFTEFFYKWHKEGFVPWE